MYIYIQYIYVKCHITIDRNADKKSYLKIHSAYHSLEYISQDTRKHNSIVMSV